VEAQVRADDVPNNPLQQLLAFFGGIFGGK
jgi:hypothetical protein